jgi:Peptidase family S51
LVDDRIAIEQAVKDSAVQSPCCGPDVPTLDLLQEVDSLLQQISVHPHPLDLLQDHPQRTLRFLYIPTAQYALRKGSDNTPGKQRQRSRADAKTRRTRIVKTLAELFPDTKILTTSLDLDDGSIKQSEGSPDISLFPKTGKDAMRSWNPHMIFLEGGNTFWLYHCMEKGGWKQDLVDFCTGPRQAVYCGQSAGAIVSGAAIQTACWKQWDDPTAVPGMEHFEDWTNVAGLNLLGDQAIFPHMDEGWTDLVNEKQQSLSSKVRTIRDTEVYLFDGALGSARLVAAPRAAPKS